MIFSIICLNYYCADYVRHYCILFIRLYSSYFKTHILIYLIFYELTRL